MRDLTVTGVQTCALPIYSASGPDGRAAARRRRRRHRTGGRHRGGVGPRRPARAPATLVRAGGACPARDRKSVVEGKSVDLGGRRIIKKKINRREDERGSL